MAAAVALAAACSGTLPPLRGQIEVGRESYAIVSAGVDAADGDFYALRADGGAVIRMTYSSVGEIRPALSPDGVRLAFLRGRAVGDSTPGSVWLMSLLTGGEREIELPKGADIPRRVGWTRDGGWLVVASDAGLYRVASPFRDKAAPVPRPERVAAESSLAVLLGDPVFARVVPCAEAGALCVAADTGAPGLLAEQAHAPARWGSDSVAFLTDRTIEVRPLGAGRARPIEWSGLPPRLMDMTAFVK